MDSCDVIDLASDEEVTSSKATPLSKKKAPNGVLPSSSSGSRDHPTAKQSSSERNELDTFKNFVNTCLKYDNSPTMQKIIKTKLWRYYENANPAYKSTSAFKQLLVTKTNEVISKPKNLYVPLKELVDELKTRVLKASEPPKKRAKLLPSTTEKKLDNILEQQDQEAGPAPKEETSPKEKVSDRLMRRLCKTLELLHRKIRKLEMKEVSWDEEEDSTYIQLQRYKERFIQVHRKLQEYEGEVGTADRNVKRIIFNGTQFPSVNRTIERYVNKKGEFPDFFDILKLLKSTYEAENITIAPEKLRIQAKTVFQEIGDQLQKKRKLDDWDCHCMYLGNERDPAEEDSELRKKLQENKMKYGGRIDEVINEFVEKSFKLKSEPEAVPEDDDNSRETSLKEDENGDDEGDDDDEEDEEESEDGENGFLEKIIEGEEEEEDLQDLKDNISLDGDDTMSDFVIHYGGPVSPPQPDMTFYNENTDDEKLEVAAASDTIECKAVGKNGHVSGSSLDYKEPSLDSINLGIVSESKETNVKIETSNSEKNCLEPDSSDSDTKKNHKNPTTPKILESLGIRSVGMNFKSVTKESSSPRKDNDLEIITLD